METETYAHYHKRHVRVYKIRGKARAQPCFVCHGAATEWATLHWSNGSDPLNDYVPMCPLCHGWYDSTEKDGQMKIVYPPSSKRRRITVDKPCTNCLEPTHSQIGICYRPSCRQAYRRTWSRIRRTRS